MDVIRRYLTLSLCTVTGSTRPTPKAHAQTLEGAIGTRRGRLYQQKRGTIYAKYLYTDDREKRTTKTDRNGRRLAI